MTQAQPQTNNLVPDAAAFEARAQADGFVTSEGFFAQDDWEFELDTMQGSSRDALISHLDKSPSHDTAMFLKAYLMDSGSHFTRFKD